MISAFGVDHGGISKVYESETRVATPQEKAQAIGKHPRLHPIRRRRPYMTIGDAHGAGTFRGTPSADTSAFGDEPAHVTVLKPGTHGKFI